MWSNPHSFSIQFWPVSFLITDLVPHNFYQCIVYDPRVFLVVKADSIHFSQGEKLDISNPIPFVRAKQYDKRQIIHSFKFSTAFHQIGLLNKGASHAMIVRFYVSIVCEMLSRGSFQQEIYCKVFSSQIVNQIKLYVNQNQPSYTHTFIITCLVISSDTVLI